MWMKFLVSKSLPLAYSILRYFHTAAFHFIPWDQVALMNTENIQSGVLYGSCCTLWRFVINPRRHGIHEEKKEEVVGIANLWLCESNVQCKNNFAIYI
jgi:hypothetical protein